MRVLWLRFKSEWARPPPLRFAKHPEAKPSGPGTLRLGWAALPR